MPNPIPIHYNGAWEVDGWAAKTPLNASFELIFQAILALVFSGIHVAFIHTRPTLADAHRPTASLITHSTYQRAMTAATLVCGALTLCSLNFITLSSAQLMSPQASMAGLLILTGVGVIVLCATGIILGQNGAKLLEKTGPITATSPASPNDADEYWKAGMFYYNRNDPALFVPKRFGIGTTLNFGHPKALAITIGFILFIVAICALPFFF